MAFSKGSLKHTRTYSGILGVERDGSGSEISERRLSYSENVYRDYEGDGAGVIESIPGYRRFARLEKRINGIFIQRCSGADFLIIHAGDDLYRVSVKYIDRVPPEKIGQVGDRKSCAFSYFGSLFLLDGEKIHIVDKYGEMKTVQPNDPAAYVPTTFVGGVTGEMRNLFTNLFKEETPLADPYEYSEETEGLTYEVSNEGLGHAVVTGARVTISGCLHIPRYKKIEGKVYRVGGISDFAFANQTGITELRVTDGLTSVGIGAFSGCTALKTISLPASVKRIEERAFEKCTSLTEVNIGKGVEFIGANAFRSAPLSLVNYGGTNDAFFLIEGATAFANVETFVDCPDKLPLLKIPIYSDVESINKVDIDGKSIEYTLKTEEEKTYVSFEYSGSTELIERVLTVSGVLKPYRSYFRREGYGFYPEIDGWGREGFASVTSATVCEMFDGRIFYGGCNELPGVVFYTERTKNGENDPLYVGIYDYFRDGGYETASLLAVRDQLAHFKRGDSGEGGIFYHKPMDTNDGMMPKAYPVSSIHSGISSLGASRSFFDDPVFLSAQGVCALRTTNIEYERSVECVSHNVNLDLLSEDLSSATLTEWQGYLAVGINGTVYLADSRAKFRHRTGDKEYEWFVLKNIGTWKYDYRMYRYSSEQPEGFDLYPEPDTDTEADDLVYSASVGGRLVYYVMKNQKRYAVYPTEEWAGGDFYPATVFASTGVHLFFGTECGDVCVFNNDKRGVAPERVASAPDFNEAEYKEAYGRYIHPDFYTFAGHAPRYAIKTKLDNCGVPFMVKDTVKGSLAVRCRATHGAKLHIEVGTDKNGYSEVASFSAGAMDFADLSFSDVSLDTSNYVSVPFAEREKGWSEKQIAIYSRGYASPIAISAISYRFTVSGKIKKR